MQRRAGRRQRRRARRGQSMIELALLLPVFCFLLLAVVDLAQAYSAQQRLEQATHLVTLRLLSTPTLSLAPSIAAEAGLPPSTVSAASTYSADANGNNHVTVSATAAYPLLLPGLRALQLGGLSSGTLALSVQASGLARTDPPTLTTDLITSDCWSTVPTALAGTSNACLRIAPASTSATPAGLGSLVCTVYRGGVPQALQPGCSATTPLLYGAASITPTERLTATLTQADGLVSLPGSWP